MPVDTNQAFMIVYHIDEVTEAPEIVEPPARMEEDKASIAKNDDHEWMALRNKMIEHAQTQQPHQNISSKNSQPTKSTKQTGGGNY